MRHEKESSNDICWLQLSDLHLRDSTEMNILWQEYEIAAKKIKPDFLVLTGDYITLSAEMDYSKPLAFIERFVKLFSIEKQDVFFVPGNHDATSFGLREALISDIYTKIETNSDIYKRYMNAGDENNLLKAFSNYSAFVRKFYGDCINDDRVKKPEHLIHHCWRDKLNIVLLNSALISDENREHREIVDINALSSIKIDNNHPIIVLCHHGIEDIHRSHRTLLKRLLNNLNVSAFLCGDSHITAKEHKDVFDDSQRSLAYYICAKSAIDPIDKYSDVGFLKYTWRPDSQVEVTPYMWKKDGSQLQLSNQFCRNIDEPETFMLYYGKKGSSSECASAYTGSITELHKSDDRKIAGFHGIEKKTSIWLPDAEHASGEQTRFQTYTETQEIIKFLRNDTDLLGISSVKGVGKTFVLQVKRVLSKRNFNCLPRFENPSSQNNWATEKVTIAEYENIATKDSLNDLTLLWKVSLLVYLINQEKTSATITALNRRSNPLELDRKIRSICLNASKYTLSSVMNTLLASFTHWPIALKKNIVALIQLTSTFLQEPRKVGAMPKIAIFIDKVDQTIEQTGAEPPADCVSCKKNDSVGSCKRTEKAELYCSNEIDCPNRKNCCYGCDVFITSRSYYDLRKNNNPVSRKAHVNLWQYFQVALMLAAYQIRDHFAGNVLVYYTMRQEALNIENNALGEHSDKIIQNSLLQLQYSIEEQRRIFLDCIKNQQDDFLFNASRKTNDGMEEFAFIGVNTLSHPYCMNSHGVGIVESVFSSLYRHSFDRSRDIQYYGQELTNHINEIKGIENESEREELIKGIIENAAADLAFCANESQELLKRSYFYEKYKYMPNYWADHENFANLLAQLDRNLFFEDDIRKICCTINKIHECPSRNHCRNKQCKRHPFSMLFQMGYLGQISSYGNNKLDVQQHFLDASRIGYFAEQDILRPSQRVLYALHPALTKCVERNYHRDFSHFSGFILGKGVKIQQTLFDMILSDYVSMNSQSFMHKYYRKRHEILSKV